VGRAWIIAVGVSLAASACALVEDLGGLRGADAGPADAGEDVAVEAAPPPLGEPPPRPDGGTPSSQVLTFAVRTVDLGDADGGAGWQTLGYDLDGKTTTDTSTDVCAPVSGGSVHADGVDGIDNGFGDSILSLIRGVNGPDSLTSAQVSSYVDQGNWTLEIEVDGLSNDPAQTAVGLSASVYEAASYGAAPAFDTSTDWPVLSTSLVDGATFGSGARITFAAAYVAGGTFVSGPSTSPVPFRIPFQDRNIELSIHAAILTFDHVSPGVGAHGVLAGVLDTQELVASFKELIGEIDPNLCDAASTQSVLGQLEQASDIFVDGTNAPTGTCSGISIGLGFEASVVANPTKVTQAPPPGNDPCP